MARRRRKKKGCLRRTLAVVLVAVVVGWAALEFQPQLEALVSPLFTTEGAVSASVETAAAPTAEAEAETDTRYDAEFRPAYGALAENQQAFYRELVEAILVAQEEIEPSAQVTEAEAQAVVAAIRTDQPDLFWLGDGQLWTRNDIVQKVTFTYTATGGELSDRREALDTAVKAIAGDLGGLPVPVQEQRVLEAIAGRAVYDESAPQAGQTAYNALVDCRAVCGGYARAFQLVMIELGVPCYYVSGQGEGGAENDSGAWGNHAWNLVKTPEGWYAVDPTWMQADIFGNEGLNYRWFNVTADDFAATHHRDDASATLPSEATEAYPIETALGGTGAELTLASAGIAIDATVSSPEEYGEYVARHVMDGETRLVFIVTGDLVNTIADYRQQVVDATVAMLGSGGLSEQAQTVVYDDGTLLVVEEYTRS